MSSPASFDSDRDAPSVLEDDVYIPDPRFLPTIRVDDGAPEADDSLGSPSIENAPPPTWGMLTGFNGTTVSFSADRRFYRVGKGANVEVPIEPPTHYAKFVSRYEFRISWNGFGIPRFGKESNVSSNEPSRNVMAFTVSCKAHNGIIVGGHTLRSLRNGEHSGLSDGMYIQLRSNEHLIGKGIAPEHLRFYFFSPLVPAKKEDQLDAFTSAYSLHEELGSGGFGTVYRAIKVANGGRYAVKKISRMKLHLNDYHTAVMEQESHIMRLLDSHEHIVKIQDAFKTDHHIYIVMELVEGQTLFELLCSRNDDLPEADVWFLLKQVIDGVAFAHRKGIVHRDLKPENILVKRGEQPVLKICDFGLGKIYHHNTALRTQLGTPPYVAPEVWEGRVYDFKVDAWSIGIIAWVLLRKKLPWPQEAHGYNQIRPSASSMEWSRIKAERTRPCVMFLECLLVDQPRSRWSVIAALDHPWLLKQPAGPAVYLEPVGSDSGSSTSTAEELDWAIRSRSIRVRQRQQQQPRIHNKAASVWSAIVLCFLGGLFLGYVPWMFERTHTVPSQ